MKDFTSIHDQDKLYSGKYFFIIKDRFPVSNGHLLIVSNELREDYFALTDNEKIDLISMIEIAKQLIVHEIAPDGYNIGMNCGEAAGQTVFHFHCHIIPRYKGDMDDPRGGVRHVITGKGYY
jgi:diadenosine tetraphosphate (Ap4A) HIT family hydrolase